MAVSTPFHLRLADRYPPNRNATTRRALQRADIFLSIDCDSGLRREVQGPMSPLLRSNARASGPRGYATTSSVLAIVWSLVRSTVSST